MTAAKTDVERTFPGTTVDTHAISISDYESIDKLMKELVTIDVLVLNAGVLHKPLPVLQLAPADIEHAFQTNVFGPLNMIRAFYKQPARGAGSRRTIIYTSAWGINFVMHGVGGYAASKAAMTYFMRAIHEENPDSAVRTFAFHPAVAYTPMARDSLGLPPDAMNFDSGGY